MKTIILLVTLLCSSGWAQTALVTELSNTDAAQAKQLYEAKVAADKAWDEAYSRIVGKYKDFAGGAEFSKDFRFIVPKSNPSTAIWSSCCWGSFVCPTITTVPAVGGLVFDSPMYVK